MQKGLERYLASCVRRTILRDKPYVVGIGGSVGKTSTRKAVKWVLEAVYSPEEFRTSHKNYNNELGVPLSVFGCRMPGRDPFKWLILLWNATVYALGIKRLQVKYLILEMAIDRPGDLEYLMNMAPPCAAIITAMGAEHTEFFGSTEAAIKEERKMLVALPEKGEAILNMDDPQTWASRSLIKAEPIGFGKQENALVRIVQTQVVYDAEHPEQSGLEMQYTILNYDSRKMRLKGVFGEPHAYAAAAAIAFASCMDLDLDIVLKHLEEVYCGMPGRTRLIPGIKHTVLLDDSYNAQPQAMASAIRDLARFSLPVGGKRIAVLGDMLELGEIAEEEHRKIGTQVAQAGIDVLVCCGTLGRIISEAAKRAGMSERRVFWFQESSSAGLFVQQEILEEHDAVLIKGSQGIRMERVTKELMAEPLRAEELLVRQEDKWSKK